jgi:hypothetical protein
VTERVDEAALPVDSPRHFVITDLVDAAGVSQIIAGMAPLGKDASNHPDLAALSQEDAQRKPGHQQSAQTRD